MQAVQSLLKAEEWCATCAHSVTDRPPEVPALHGGCLGTPSITHNKAIGASRDPALCLAVVPGP